MYKGKTERKFISMLLILLMVLLQVIPVMADGIPEPVKKLGISGESSVEFDSGGGTTVYEAVYKVNGIVQEPLDDLKWTMTGNNKISIEESTGVVTIDGDADTQTVNITVFSSKLSMADDMDVTFTKVAEEVKEIVITGKGEVEVGDTLVSEEYTAEYQIDAIGHNEDGIRWTWAVGGDDDNIIGLDDHSSTYKINFYSPATSGTIQVTAVAWNESEEMLAKNTIDVDVNKKPADPLRVANITGGASSLTVDTTKNITEQYTVTCMRGETDITSGIHDWNWSLIDSKDGVSIDSKGKLIIPAGAGTQTFTIKVSTPFDSTIKADKEVTITRPADPVVVSEIAGLGTISYSSNIGASTKYRLDYTIDGVAKYASNQRWKVSGIPNVTIDQYMGILSIPPNTPSGDITITITSSSEGIEVSKDITLLATNTDIETIITGEENGLMLPESGTKTEQFSIVYKEDGVEVPVDDWVWWIPEFEKVTLETTNEVARLNFASDTPLGGFTMRVSSVSKGVSDSISINFSEFEEEPEIIPITILGKDSIDIPETTYLEETYTMTVTIKGEVFTSEYENIPLAWSLNKEATGVSINEKTGVLRVNQNASAQDVNIHVCLDEDKYIIGDKTVSIVKPPKLTAEDFVWEWENLPSKLTVTGEETEDIVKDVKVVIYKRVDTLQTNLVNAESDFDISITRDGESIPSDIADVRWDYRNQKLIISKDAKEGVYKLNAQTEIVPGVNVICQLEVTVDIEIIEAPKYHIKDTSFEATTLGDFYVVTLPNEIDLYNESEELAEYKAHINMNRLNYDILETMENSTKFILVGDYHSGRMELRVDLASGEEVGTASMIIPPRDKDEVYTIEGLDTIEVVKNNYVVSTEIGNVKVTSNKGQEFTSAVSLDIEKLSEDLKYSINMNDGNFIVYTYDLEGEYEIPVTVGYLKGDYSFKLVVREITDEEKKQPKELLVYSDDLTSMGILLLEGDAEAQLQSKFLDYNGNEVEVEAVSFEYELESSYEGVTVSEDGLIKASEDTMEGAVYIRSKALVGDREIEGSIRVAMKKYEEVGEIEEVYLYIAGNKVTFRIIYDYEKMMLIEKMYISISAEGRTLSHTLTGNQSYEGISAEELLPYIDKETDATIKVQLEDIKGIKTDMFTKEYKIKPLVNIELAKDTVKQGERLELSLLTASNPRPDSDEIIDLLDWDVDWGGELTRVASVNKLRYSRPTDADKMKLFIYTTEDEDFNLITNNDSNVYTIIDSVYLNDTDKLEPGSYRMAVTAYGDLGFGVKDFIVEDTDTDSNHSSGGGGSSHKEESESMAKDNDLISKEVEESENPTLSLKGREEKKAVIESDTMETLIESKKDLTLESDEISITLPNSNLEDLDVEEDEQLSVVLDTVEEKESNKVLKDMEDKSNLKPVTDKVFKFNIEKSNKDGSGQELIKTVKEPVAVTIDLKDKNISRENLSLLTGVKIVDGVSTKLGGKYNKKDGTFTFYVNQGAEYSVALADELHQIHLTVNDYYADDDNKTVELDTPPRINKDSRTMVPLRFIAEALGSDVDWNPTTRIVKMDDGKRTLSLTIGETQNGLDTAPVIEKGRTLVPLRYVSEQLGANVLWYPSKQKIEIVK